MDIFPPLNKDCTLLLDKMIETVDKVFPLPGRFAGRLKDDVRELSGLLTSQRSERSLSYLGKPNLLSAYLRYFLPWNVFRLCRLVPSLPLNLINGDLVLDIGSGPLTFILALWISCPDLRNTSLEFIALDSTPKVLDAGKKLFDALAPESKWKIRTMRGKLLRNSFLLSRNGREIHLPPGKITDGKPIALVSAVNIFNEIYWELSPADRSGQCKLVEQSARLLAACAGNGTILVVEPGIPRSGEFISGLRSSFLAEGFDIISPCPHDGTCAFPGGIEGKTKAKWCHFSFITNDAPPKLLKLSEAAGIPKERAILSFLMAAKTTSDENLDSKEHSGPATMLRIVSDYFPVGKVFGRYACSEQGPVLITGIKDKIEELDSGSCISLHIRERRDKKSGALIGEI